MVKWLFTFIFHLKQCNCLSWDLLDNLLGILIAPGYQSATNVKYQELLIKAFLWKTGKSTPVLGLKLNSQLSRDLTNYAFRSH